MHVGIFLWFHLTAVNLCSVFIVFKMKRISVGKWDVRLRGKPWLLQFFSIASNYAHNKKILKKQDLSDGQGWSCEKGVLFYFHLLWFGFFQEGMPTLSFFLDLISFLNHWRKERFSSKYEQPSWQKPANLALQMLALFSSPVGKKNKASIIILVEIAY